jgi:hypothetical protein
MGIAAEVFRFDSLAPNETANLFVHGYGTNEYAGFSIVPQLASNVPPAAVSVRAQLTHGPTHFHVDQTVGFILSMQNQSVGPQPYISVRVLSFFQSI